MFSLSYPSKNLNPEARSWFPPKTLNPEAVVWLPKKSPCNKLPAPAAFSIGVMSKMPAHFLDGILFQFVSARAVNYDPATNVCSLVEPSNAANSSDVYKIAQL